MRVDTVQDVNIFPIKSCQAATAGGEAITELAVAQTGFEHSGVADREWVLAEDDSDLFVSQRGWDKSEAKKHPNDARLATVAVDIRHDHLYLSAEGHGQILLPTAEHAGQTSKIAVHSKEVDGTVEDEQIGAFFSELLGRSVKLVRSDRTKPVPIPVEYQQPGLSNVSLAADKFPFLLTSQASLDQLHAAAGLALGTMPLNRFRGNIEISGAEWGAFAEDTVIAARIGRVFEALMGTACSRCPMPNVNQATGAVDKLSTKLLARERSGWRITEDSETVRPSTFFGQNLNHLWVPGEVVVIRVGDSVEALEVGQSNIVLKNG